jgi:D-tyrosyl-tRNA(Tyr) deacylase
MIALIQRVNDAQVIVKEELISKISKGILVFLAVSFDDTAEDAEYLARKIINYRIFEDDAGKMNLSARDIGAEILVVSQFTLLAATKKGMRPSFSNAAEPAQAQKLYELTADYMQKEGIKPQLGVFKAHMRIKLENDGPVTFILNSK